MNTNTCHQCGIQFIPSSRGAQGRGQRFCSHHCKGIASRGVEKKRKTPCRRVSRVCLNCASEFIVRAAELKHTPCLFCSQQCGFDYKTIPLSVRFKSYIGTTEPCGCVLWNGSTNGRKGYGVIQSDPRGGKLVLAHRVAYELANGAIPDGMCVLHKCDTPLCVNADHLFLGTIAENNADMLSKNRHSHGEKHVDAKLTAIDVQKIRDRDYKKRGMQASTAREYGVSPSTIRDIIVNRTWRC